MHCASPGSCWSPEPESEPLPLGVPDEDWKQDEGFDAAQQSLASAQPVWHQSCTQEVALGKPPGQVVRISLQRAWAPSMAMAGAEESQLGPKGSLASQSWAVARLRGEMRMRRWRGRMMDREWSVLLGGECESWGKRL